MHPSVPLRKTITVIISPAQMFPPLLNATVVTFTDSYLITQVISITILNMHDAFSGGQVCTYYKNPLKQLPLSIKRPSA
ncbi:MAG: hypothetical protein CSYNP_02116 [Syntrophus sp. SKADARSKE-3]|nr:hypothetical protein [Syntrophus sp. SKADARSKE-3]